jgi:hypothetical protein
VLPELVGKELRDKMVEFRSFRFILLSVVVEVVVTIILRSQARLVVLVEALDCR